MSYQSPYSGEDVDAAIRRTVSNGVIYAIDYCEGDGVADDTARFAAALAAVPSGGTLDLGTGLTYLVSASTITKSDIAIIGRSTIKCRSTISNNGRWLDWTGNNVSFHDVVFDADEKTCQMFGIGAYSTDWEFTRCRFKNAKISSATGLAAALTSSTMDGVLIRKGCRDIDFHRCRFENFQTDYTASGAGIRCIRAAIFPLISDSAQWEADRFDRIRITGCDFYNIGPDATDSDPICFQNQVPDVNDEQICDFLIQDCKFLMNGRRAIKLECGGGTVVGNKIFLNRPGPANGDSHFAAISVYGPQTVVIGNNIHGPDGCSFYGIEVSWLTQFGQPRGVSVVGNVITCNENAQSFSYGIILKGARSTTVIGNQTKNFFCGINIAGNCENIACNGNTVEENSSYGILVQSLAVASGAGYGGTPTRVTLTGNAVSSDQYGIFLSQGTLINVLGTTGNAGVLVVSRAVGVTGESKGNTGAVEGLVASSTNSNYSYRIDAATTSPHITITGPFGTTFYTYDDGTKIHSLYGSTAHTVITNARWNFNKTTRTMATLTYAASTNIDFTSNDVQKVTLAGDITFTGSGMLPYTKKTLIVVGDGSTRTLAWPAWTALGSALPTSLAAGKTLKVELHSTGATAASVLAEWVVQP